MTRALAVFDLGKTNAKLVLFSETGETLAERRTHQDTRVAGGMKVLDADALEAWLRAGLAALAQAFEITGLMIATHGCAFAIIREGRLAAPILDYEQPMPDEAERAFAAMAPPFSETFTPDLPGGLNMARHIFLQEWLLPGSVAGSDHILTYPQYWAWRLTGALASEVSFLGCHSHLWQPLQGDFSSIVDRMGWRAKFPPLRLAGEILGHVRIGGQEIAVHNGVHDSNAAFHFYRSLGFDRFTLVSTGTWVIVFDPSCPLSALDAGRDMLANVTVRGEPVATARFMGGREFDILSGGARGSVTPADIGRVIAEGQMALPSFAAGGPFPGHAGRLTGPPPSDKGARAAMATLYVALMTDLVLDSLGSRGDILLDGGLAQNAMLPGLIAALRPRQALYAAPNPEGTAMGAAALAFAATGWTGVFRMRPERIEPVAPEGLAVYRDAWRRAAAASG